MNIPDTSMPRIVVVGGGFAGLAFCKNIPHDKFQIVLIDKHNYHTFQPLLYQVATAGLEPDSVAYPLRKIFQSRPDFYFRLCVVDRSEEHTSELQSRPHLVCRLLLEKKNNRQEYTIKLVSY